MLALASVWIAMAALLLALTMVVYRPVFTDLAVTLVVYFGSPGALCFAGLVLWAHRKANAADEAVAGQRVQAKVAIVLALLAAAIVYLLIVYSQRISEEVGGR